MCGHNRLFGSGDEINIRMGTYDIAKWGSEIEIASEQTNRYGNSSLVMLADMAQAI